MATNIKAPPGNTDGFDKFLGRKWIYPNNMAIRGYQKQAVEKALFTNAMIVLPTGFGKTFIAAVVMHNFHRWYPTGKIIFVAPTKPLVRQQIEECKKISGIPSSDCVEITGATQRAKRGQIWDEKRVFFATPQVIENDLENYSLPARQVKCLVIDEAHRAQGSYAYVKIVQCLQERNKDGFRILALSATPGSDISRVQQVMLNLYIGDVMFKTENDIDLMRFKNEKVTKAWTVELFGKHREFVDKFIKITSSTFKELNRAGLTWGGDSVDKVNKFSLIKALRGEGPDNSKVQGRLKFLATIATSLKSSFECLTLYGIRVFYSYVMRDLSKPRSEIKVALSASVEFDTILESIRTMFGDYLNLDMTKRPDNSVDLLQGHPKLSVVKDLLFKHFSENEHKEETRVIIFTKYRDSVYDIVQALLPYDAMIKAGAFIGQGNRDGGGMSQKEQIKMVNDFKSGIYNVLVATCVAEEGLDIGEVDLIICYDTTSSPISNTQRRGRTGRKRSGNVQTLLTKGFEEKKLKKAGDSRRLVESQLFKRENYISHRYQNAPRLVPHDVIPVCLEQKINPVDDVKEDKKPKRKRPEKGDTDEQCLTKSGKKKKKKTDDDKDDFGKKDMDHEITIISDSEEETTPKTSIDQSCLLSDFDSDKETPPRTSIDQSCLLSDFESDKETPPKTSIDRSCLFSDDEDDGNNNYGNQSKYSNHESPVTSSGFVSQQPNHPSPREKVEQCDSDIEWESDLEYDCV